MINEFMFMDKIVNCLYTTAFNYAKINTPVYNKKPEFKSTVGEYAFF